MKLKLKSFPETALEKALEARSRELPMLEADPIFETVGADRRFPALLDRPALPR